MNTPPEMLDQFLSWLKEDFEVLSLEASLRLKSSRHKFEKPACAVTFDDGWQDNFEFGYPILKKHRIPGTDFSRFRFYRHRTEILARPALAGDCLLRPSDLIGTRWWKNSGNASLGARV